MPRFSKVRKLALLVTVCSVGALWSVAQAAAEESTGSRALEPLVKIDEVDQKQKPEAATKPAEKPAETQASTKPTATTTDKPGSSGQQVKTKQPATQAVTDPATEEKPAEQQPEVAIKPEVTEPETTEEPQVTETKPGETGETIEGEQTETTESTETPQASPPEPGETGDPEKEQAPQTTVQSTDQPENKPSDPGETGKPEAPAQPQEVVQKDEDADEPDDAPAAAKDEDDEDEEDVEETASDDDEEADEPDTEAAGIEEPEEPLAKAAFNMLKKHCARCHQEGLLEKRTKPASNFGNTLLLEELAADTRFVIPGNPDASEIVKRVADPVRSDMPYDVRNAELTGETTDYPTPTADELNALRDWVKSLESTAVASCSKDDLIDNAELVKFMAEDLEKLPDHELENTRYITLTNLKNACVPEKKMEVFRQAVIKLLNSLSQNSEVLTLETVDDAKTIIRFNLNDLEWTQKDWERILKVYPYASKPDVRLFSHLQKQTGTVLPYVRGDWLAFSASRPPLYYDLLKLPKTFQELQEQVDLDIEENLEKFLAHRAAFQNSGVSQNNRLIERHTISDGVFWTSYDFAGNKKKQSLFEHPLGPGGEDGFEADGGETIYSLPNGFHAYYLNTADGKRLDKGPTEIVLDDARVDSAVTNGISCFGCHDQGIRYNKDQVREHVLSTRTHSKEVREAVEALYPEADELKALLDKDQKDWADAMEEAGIDPLLKLNDVEMINALSDQYERQDLTMRYAAAEFGMDEESFANALDKAGSDAYSMKRRLSQGLVPRDHFEVRYAEMLTRVSDDEMVEDDEIDHEDIPAEEIVKPLSTSAGSFDIALFSDKSVYQIKDAPTITVETEVDCYLTLINVDTKGTATVLFPNKFQQDNLVEAGKKIEIPGKKAGFEFKLNDIGTETVIANCTEDKDAYKGIKHSFSKQAFTSLGNYRSFVTRQITVVKADEKAEKDEEDEEDKKDEKVEKDEKDKKDEKAEKDKDEEDEKEESSDEKDDDEKDEKRVASTAITFQVK